MVACDDARLLTLADERFIPTSLYPFIISRLAKQQFSEVLEQFK